MISKDSLKDSLALYAVTQSEGLEGRSLAECVKDAILGGATFVQLREKNMSEAAMILRARTIRTICSEAQVPFVINDSIEVAARAQADGVHLGQSDEAVSAARERLGENALVGVSVHNVEQALAAQEQGADYLGVGALFPTDTKQDTELVTVEELRTICEAVSIPVVAIGGIKKHNICELSDSGIDGVAVVSALFSCGDIALAATALRAEVRSSLGV